MRYGKGALIVAIPKEDVVESDKAWNDIVLEVRDKFTDQFKIKNEIIKSLNEERKQLGDRKTLTPSQRQKEESNIQEEIDKIQQEIQECREHHKLEIEPLSKQFYSHLQVAMFYTQLSAKK